MKVPETNPVISVKNISKTFYLRQKTGIFKSKKIPKYAVQEASFDIYPGEIVGFIGTNGAGKSTTIKMMTGILTPTAGSCQVNGITPYESRIKNAKNISVVFGQRTQMNWDLTVEDNFKLLKEIYDVSDEDFERQLKLLEEHMGIKKLWIQQVRSLSLGQRVLMDIAIALIHSPKVIYLDEPTIGLDIMIKDKILKTLKLINQQENVTIILTTHDLNEIELLCDRIIIIEEGHIIYDGSKEAMLNHFSSNTTIQFDIELEELSELEHFLSEYDLNHSLEGVTMSITINQEEQNEKEILSKLYRQFSINKMAVARTTVQDVVRSIYTQSE
ncbi:MULTISPECIES: ATP-binding cassette domain-containing protein [Vagococcus]|uniref:ABC transporter, ATP-binding protein n=1 Tax=Vagococcus fluvialis bH819 TaxID=1255619 RepID=A0A1X6WP44_9ENTE|nr:MULTISPECIES: ATP-binding cassette domain-containing protein [Vagococcus]SLM86101.1 ABC transporter, ATP-binding protein [Vagococcus fluvialis bH819]HCM90350.1 sugar ABC transporter ATP-binding protein [Vagococcus sp.]